MTKVAIYARYSSDNQRDASIEDQLRICREHAAKVGWSIFDTYTDHGLSGASMMRPGIQAMMQDAMAGRFAAVGYSLVAIGLIFTGRASKPIAQASSQMARAKSYQLHCPSSLQ